MSLEQSVAAVFLGAHKKGSHMNRKGFTLIELLIVVVIIGILAAIAIPKFANTKEKAYLATMKSDLRNLITAEESYFADNTAYTTALPATMYTVSTGDAGPTITVTGANYQAWVSNANTPRTCAVFIGTTPLAPATKEGQPTCM
jgi:prepilin-type N-terminal cleavage/methylation domain-containing protein